MAYVRDGSCFLIKASILAVTLGSIMGILIGALQVVPVKPIKGLAAAYIYVIRGTPLLIQLF